MIEESTFHRVRENSAEAGVDSFDGGFRDWQAGVLTSVCTELSVEFPEVFRAKL